eukprot:2367539-Amphidinium_carterae.1
MISWHSTCGGSVASTTGVSFDGMLDSSAVMTALQTGHSPGLVYSSLDAYQCMQPGAVRATTRLNPFLGPPETPPKKKIPKK